MVILVESGVKKFVLKIEERWLSDSIRRLIAIGEILEQLDVLNTWGLLWLIPLFTGLWSRPNIAGEWNLVAYSSSIKQ